MEIKYYNTIDFSGLKSGGGLVILEGFKPVSQIADNACACACVRMLFAHFKMPDVGEEELLALLGTEPYPVGTRLAGIISCLKPLGFRLLSSYDLKNSSGYSFTTYKAFRDFVTENLTVGRPVLVENVDYGGHWKIITGFHARGSEDSDMLIFADPYSEKDFENGGFAFCGASRFFSMWFDDHCLLPEERIQPFLVCAPPPEPS